MGTYTTARICLNRHLISTDSSFSDPNIFCSKCGAPTTNQCSSCNSPIHGRYQIPGVMTVGGKYTIPAYCYHCGTPYPWTKTALESAEAIIREDELLSEEQMQQFYACLPDLLTDTPKTTLALIRFKKFVDKATSATSAALYNILKDIISEAIKKQLFGN